MNEELSPEIANNPALAPRVRKASAILKEIIGQSVGGRLISVSVRWSLEKLQNGLESLRLSLEDSTGASAEAAFDAAGSQLGKEEYLRSRLLRVWGDLLQDRSHRQLSVLSSNVDVSGPLR
jgi:hypothetical protein